MSKLYKLLFWMTILAMVVANIYLFGHSIKVSDEILALEKKTRDLHVANIGLVKEVSFLSSLVYAEKAAIDLQFVKKGTPTFLNKLGVALKN
ncbi:MAG: hypothetical protein UR68_C0002G0024 [Candidatus Roizmanbacteria bacterium GW2011_GWA2_35_19]|uniref:Cell division protein FtsL n=2 Tax=Candidatus Roizmaniibacteriota TaxID=1752723 RepID=A0A0G0CCK1_9BACT|nr:MAG: hypothetical protein UR63_C0006G0012 [Candidatus Roizmanbacteria bacterium GW2011_GWC2_35_12]KKP73801.1 MAG: hypothetical protein UR68_C0002G0024 [Candidatus Roizmanbacteria bacterium GW2011_GWA2_35_19]